MIWLLSDLHGSLDFTGWQDFAARQDQDDILILLGDVELQEAGRENNPVFTETILSAPKPIWIVDGNHENFEWLNSCPEEDWNGGRVHRLAENVLHLQRGYVYDLAGFSCFVFGGTSATVSDAELERAYENLKKQRYQVDFILTHDYYKVSSQNRKNAFEDLLAFLDEKVTFKRWYCGHHHLNKTLDDKHTVVYDQLIPISSEEA